MSVTSYNSDESSSGSYESSSDVDIRKDKNDTMDDDEADMDISSGEDDGSEMNSSLPG